MEGGRWGCWNSPKRLFVQSSGFIQLVANYFFLHATRQVARVEWQRCAGHGDGVLGMKEVNKDLSQEPFYTLQDCGPPAGMDFRLACVQLSRLHGDSSPRVLLLFHYDSSLHSRLFQKRGSSCRCSCAPFFSAQKYQKRNSH